MIDEAESLRDARKRRNKLVFPVLVFGAQVLAAAAISASSPQRPTSPGSLVKQGRIEPTTHEVQRQVRWETGPPECAGGPCESGSRVTEARGRAQPPFSAAPRDHGFESRPDYQPMENTR